MRAGLRQPRVVVSLTDKRAKHWHGAISARRFADDRSRVCVYARDLGGRSILCSSSEVQWEPEGAQGAFWGRA